MKKTFFYWIVVLIPFLFSTSCGMMYFKLRNKKKFNLELFYNSKLDKKLVGIPLIHIAKPEFYAQANEVLDSLRNEGFVVFYEGLLFDTLKHSPQEIDTMYLKLRKMIGLNIRGGYDDKTNKSLPWYIKSDKFVGQSSELLGLKKGDQWVDLSADSLIKLYENDHGKIKLTNCDYETPLNAKYKCDTVPGYLEVLHGYRDEYIAQQVKKSPHKKIALVYGKAHFAMSFRGRFQKMGYSWDKE